MALETGTYISDLVATNPAAGDSKSQGDDHLRLVKAAVKATFPNLTGAMTQTQNTINNTLSGPAFSAYKSSNQSVTTGVATKVTFDTEDFDTWGAFSSSRWTPGIEGYYDIAATIDASASAAPDVVLVEIWKNGAVHARGNQFNGAGATIIGASVQTKVFLDADDYVEVYVTVTGTSPVVGGQAASFARITYFGGNLIRVS